MARLGRKSLNIGSTKINSKIQRIRIPQPTKRPIVVTQRKFYNVYELRNNPWWWITHKRGLNRKKVGLDPREMRAVSKAYVKGTLPERIVFKWLTDHNFISGIDFTFQSSWEGGRLELGGLVVDFKFDQLHLVLQIQGPTHNQLLRQQKDREQRMILASYGFDVLEIDDDLIYNEGLFNQEMSRIFNLNSYRGGGTSDLAIYGLEEHNHDPMLLDVMTRQAEVIYSTVIELQGMLT